LTVEMPRKLDQYVVREYGRRGQPVYYFRRGKGKRIRLPAPGSPGYEEAYQAARTGTVASKAPASAKTLKWLIARYRDSSAYRGLSEATRRQRDNIFKGVVEGAGNVDYRRITRRKIVEGREDRAATPAQARNFLDAMRGLFRWALEAELVQVDPTAGVKNPARPKGASGFAAWTDDDVAAYEARWPAGTKERVWLHVLLYTGLRRGDAVVLGRQHVKDGVATLKTEKTGVEVNIPILPELAETLEIGPTGDLAFIVGENRKPLTKETFGNFFRAACRAAGIEKSAHGVRKIGATRAAESGLTVNELEALFGWTGGTMASHYTRTADRKKLALAAAEKIRNRNAPHGKVAVRGKSRKE